MEFHIFAEKVQNKVNELIASGKTLVRSNMEPDKIWETYLESIPAEKNPIFRQRRYYDSNYDKNFIRRVGGLMTVHDGILESIWDVSVDSFFNDVAKTVSEAVKAAGTNSYFLENEKVAGHKPNIDNYDESIMWEHFYIELPSQVVNSHRAEALGDLNTTYQVFKRSMDESNVDDIKSVIALIEENGLYRGEEHLNTLNKWLDEKVKYDALTSDKNLYALENSKKLGMRARFRNTVIGTLIADLYDGVDFEKAVLSFENKVAPHNYKRTSAIVTAKQIEDARQKLEELGYLDSIYRRVMTDVELPTESVLFRSQAQKAVSVFDEMVDTAKKSTKKVDISKAREISLQDLIDKLPDIAKLELLPTANTFSHRVALTTSDAEKSMFAWDNNVAWSYLNSETTDAIKERVKRAGGNVEGEVRVSLAWYNYDDLDLHCRTPRGEIYHGHKKVARGELDVDMNAGGRNSREPVENIYWAYKNDMANGEYRFFVYQFNRRESIDVGFQVQVEIDGEIRTYKYDQRVSGYIDVITLRVRNGQVEIVSEALPVSGMTSATDEFIEVDKVFFSPNHWTNTVGNKHLILSTKDYDVDKPIRGFFNEYLDPALTKHRKVFEIMGGRLKIEEDLNQALRGYGFSTSLHDSFVIRATDHNGRPQLAKVVI